MSERFGAEVGEHDPFRLEFRAVPHHLPVRDVRRVVPVEERGFADEEVGALRHRGKMLGPARVAGVSDHLSADLDAKVLIDLRTPELTRAALGGDYPFISVYMRADWVAQNKGVVQRVVNAYVKTLKWIATHSPAEIADKLPADYYAGDKDLYLSALTGSMPMYSPDGKMPAAAPDFILKVLQTYNTNVKGKTIDLTKTWTNEYVDAAK